MNKQLQYYWNCYCDSSDTKLSHVYGKYSAKKEKAYEYCRNDMAELNGEGFRILTHSIYTFTVGFIYRKNGVRTFRVHTPSKILECEVPKTC